MTTRAIARAILTRVARPRVLLGWLACVAVGLGFWALLSRWWGQDFDATMLILVSSGLVMGLTGTISFLLASDVVRLALVAGATRRRLLSAWALVAPAVVVPIVVLVTATAALVGSSIGSWPGTLVPAAAIGAVLWFAGLGMVCALASRRRGVRCLGTGALIALALGALVGAGATTFEPVAGWLILGLTLLLTLIATAALTLRTPVPPDLVGLMTGPATTRKATS